jgi:membrane protein implicated in regulation of membrane protease activity
MLRGNKGYFYLLLWIAAAVLLLYYGNSWLAQMRHKTNVTGDKNFVILGETAYALVLGACLSLLVSLPGKFKPHKPLLLALFVPCFILFMYGVAAQYVKLPEIPWYAEVTRFEGRFFFGVVSGLSLMQGLFESRRK